MAEHGINIRTKQRFKESESDISDDRRRPHKVYFTDDEWKVIVGKADWVNRAPSVYLREVGLGYKPIVPDPEFRHQLMRIGDDIRKLFAFLKGMNLSQEDRYQTMCEIGFLKRWTEGVSKILDFLDKWIKRV